MTLPSSGPLSLVDIQTEFGGNNPVSISEYYGAASGVPASGTISIADFYGKSSTSVSASGSYSTTTQSGYTYYRCTGTTNFTVSGNVSLEVFQIAGGGFGGGAGGGGGGGGRVSLNTVAATTGTYTATVGLGYTAIYGGYNSFGSNTYRASASSFYGSGVNHTTLGGYNGGSRGLIYDNDGGDSTNSGGSGVGLNNPDYAAGGGGGSHIASGNSSNSQGGSGASGYNLTGWGSYSQRYGAGGGGGAMLWSAGGGGSGGGGNGSTGTGGNGTDYLGAGGGGGGGGQYGGDGGNGVVIVRHAS